MKLDSSYLHSNYTSYEVDGRHLAIYDTWHRVRRHTVRERGGVCWILRSLRKYAKNIYAKLLSFQYGLGLLKTNEYNNILVYTKHFDKKKTTKTSKKPSIVKDIRNLFKETGSTVKWISRDDNEKIDLCPLPKRLKV